LNTFNHSTTVVVTKYGQPELFRLFRSPMITPD